MKHTTLTYLEVYGPLAAPLVVPHGDREQLTVLEATRIGDEIRYTCILVSR